ncbi:MAG: leucine-rich repeat protein [Lachnospiraceae bacterium]|nr:leucine-rich repeat protein [Lachnospiraceae bacterium]
MMKKSRFIGFMLFAILMVAGLMFRQVPARADDVYSGTTGDCTWEYDQKTHTLTVSGEGRMANGGHPEWHSYASDIEHIVIEDGVIRIGYFAFYECDQVQSVHIPASVQTISMFAFAKCTSLKEVTFEEGLLSIFTSGFDGSGLTSVTLPESLNWIGDYAFNDCQNLASVTMGNNVTNIGFEAFFNTALTEITIPASVTDMDIRAVGYRQQDSEKVPVDCFVIRGALGSTAETYANENGIGFEEYILKYNLKIDDVTVTEKNCEDILNNGVFKYADGVLTINGTYSGKSGNTLIQNGIDGLTIRVDDKAVLNSEQGGILTSKSLTITGDGSLTLNCDRSAILIDNGEEQRTLTIKDLNLKVTGSWPLSGNGKSKLVVDHAFVHAIANINGIDVAVGDFSDGIELTGCAVLSPEKGSFENGRITDMEGTAAREVLIMAGEYYDLYIEDVRVFSGNYADILENGVFSYDPKKNILTVKKSYTTSENYLIRSEINGLQIETAGNEEITLCSSNKDGSCMELGDDTTITGSAKLHLESHGPCIVVSENAFLDVWNINLTINADHYGIIGGNVEYAEYGMGGPYKSKLILKTCNLSVNTNQGYAIAGFAGSADGIKMDFCSIKSPAAAFIQNGTIYSGQNVPTSSVEIVAIEKYMLAIGDTEVTSVNCDDILGDGALSYDPEKKILTIKKSVSVNGGLFLESEIKNLIIETVGNQEIVLKQIEDEGCVLGLGGDTTIRGSAKLVLRGKSGIIVGEGCHLTLDHVDMLVDVVWYGIITEGIREQDVLAIMTIDSSNLTINVSYTKYEFDMAIGGFAVNNGITLVGCSITEPEKAKIVDGYIVDENGKNVINLTITVPSSGGWKQDKNGWWYQNPDKTYPKNQWKKIDGKWYHFDANGYMQTGWYKEGETYYYLKKDGSMACDEWVENDKYYLDANGKWIKGKVKENEGGWKQDKNGWWYQNPDKSYPKNQWKKIDGKWYHFDAKGYRQTGWYKEGSTYYYLKEDGSLAHDEWVEDGKYYLDANGKWVQGKIKVEEKTGTWKKDNKGWWYQFEDKTYAKNTWIEENGKYYHFGADGYMQTGWYKEGGYYYYLKSNGSMARDEWVENEKYYLDSEGHWIKDI